MENTNAGASTADTELQGIIDQYSNSNQAAGDNAQTTPQGTAAPEGTQPATEPAPNTQTNNTQPNPANAAFAQMRTENAKLRAFMESYAQLNDLDANNFDAINAQVNEKLTAKQAQQAQVPPEFMKRFNEQQAMINAIMNQTAQTNLTNAFNQLKTAQNLDDNSAAQFAQELRDGDFDLSDLSKLGTYYKGLHFDELVKAEVQRALNDATVAQQYTEQHAATVSTQQGTGDSAGNTGDAVADTLATIYAGLEQLK